MFEFRRAPGGLVLINDRSVVSGVCEWQRSEHRRTRGGGRRIQLSIVRDHAPHWSDVFYFRFFP